MVRHSSDAPKRQILPIQYLRGIAALMVVWHHARGQVPGVEELVGGNFGPSGVDLFFVISGFIMVVTTDGLSIRPLEFFKRRLIRVVPLYWTLTLVMVAVSLIFPGLFKTLQVSGVALIQSLFFIPHYSNSFPQQIWPLLVPGWTLNYEMFFYAIFGMLLFAPERLRISTLALLFLASCIVGFVFGPFKMASANIYTNILLLEFVVGALIGRWWAKNGMITSAATSASFILLGSILLVLRDSPPLGKFMQMSGATLIVVGALNVRFGGWNNYLLRILGDSSYSLYLTHIFTLGALRVVWVYFSPQTTTFSAAASFMIFSLFMCALVGWASFRWIESPLSSIFNRRSNRNMNTFQNK